MELQDVKPGNLKSRPYRLAILTSHPIQYFGPLFRRLAQQTQIDLTVLYCSLRGATPSEDPGFGLSFAWDIPLLEGYKYKILKNYWPGRMEGFFSCLNPGVVSELKAGAYDAVIVFGWGNLTAWLAFVSAQLAGIPWMLYGDSVSLYERENGWLKAKVKTALLASLFRKTAAFLVMGRFNQMFYESYGVSRSKCFPVPYPVDNDFFATAAEQGRQHREEIRATYGIPPNIVLLLFVGKLIPGKRPQDILAVLKHLQPSVPYLGAAFVGEGELRASLETETTKQDLKNVFFLGFKNQTELPEVYAMSDIFVLPSIRENWGLVTNEAMACGLPVVVTNRTGVSGDNVKDGDNGFVYPAGKLGALEKIVHTLAVNPELRNHMGKRSLEIIQNYGYSQCVEGILKALERLRKASQCES